MKNIAESTWYGIGSFLPGILFLIPIGVAFIVTQREGEILATYEFPLMLVALLMAGLSWFYIITMTIDAANHCEDNVKIIWIILLYLMNVFVFPVYWFVCVRKRTDHY